MPANASTRSRNSTTSAKAGGPRTTGCRLASCKAVGYANAVPTFREATVGALTWRVNEAVAEELPAGLSYAGPTDPTATGGVIAGTPTAETAACTYTLTWTAGRPGSATPGDDYPAAAAGQITLAVPTLGDRRVEPTETFTVLLPVDTSIELAKGAAEGRIKDDDTEHARQRSLRVVLAGVGRTLATDAVAVIGDRVVRSPTTPQATMGGQALNLDRDPQRNRWHQAAGVAYGVGGGSGRAIRRRRRAVRAGGRRGVEHVTRHLCNPHAPAPPLSAWDAPVPLSNASWDGVILPPSGRGLELAPDLIWREGVPRHGKARLTPTPSIAPISPAWRAVGKD